MQYTMDDTYHIVNYAQHGTHTHTFCAPFQLIFDGEFRFSVWNVEIDCRLCYSILCYTNIHHDYYEVQMSLPYSYSYNGCAAFSLLQCCYNHNTASSFSMHIISLVFRGFPPIRMQTCHKLKIILYSSKPKHTFHIKISEFRQNAIVLVTIPLLPPIWYS